MTSPALGLIAYGDHRLAPIPVPPGVLPPPRADVPLLAVAHGTSDPQGIATLEALLERVRFLRPGVETSLSFVSVARPRVADELIRLLAEGVTEVVVLPLLLGSGYHVRHDIPEALRIAARETGITGNTGDSADPSKSAKSGKSARSGNTANIYPAAPLGPDPLLAAAMHDRLSAAHGTVFGMQIVLAAAGSADRTANAAAVAMAGLLAERLGMPVRAGFVSTAEPDISTLLNRLARRGRPIAVATYLLASGEFSRRIEESATLAALAADQPPRIRVSQPLGAHDQVARLVLRRYDAALAGPPLNLSDSPLHSSDNLAAPPPTPED